MKETFSQRINDIHHALDEKEQQQFATELARLLERWEKDLRARPEELMEFPQGPALAQALRRSDETQKAGCPSMTT